MMKTGQTRASVRGSQPQAAQFSQLACSPARNEAGGAGHSWNAMVVLRALRLALRPPSRGDSSGRITMTATAEAGVQRVPEIRGACGVTAFPPVRRRPLAAARPPARSCARSTRWAIGAAWEVVLARAPRAAVCWEALIRAGRAGWLAGWHLVFFAELAGAGRGELAEPGRAGAREAGRRQCSCKAGRRPVTRTYRTSAIRDRRSSSSRFLSAAHHRNF